MAHVTCDVCKKRGDVCSKKCLFSIAQVPGRVYDDLRRLFSHKGMKALFQRLVQKCITQKKSQVKKLQSCVESLLCVLKAFDQDPQWGSGPTKKMKGKGKVEVEEEEEEPACEVCGKRGDECSITCPFWIANVSGLDYGNLRRLYNYKGMKILFERVALKASDQKKSVDESIQSCVQSLLCAPGPSQALSELSNRLRPQIQQTSYN